MRGRDGGYDRAPDVPQIPAPGNPSRDWLMTIVAILALLVAMASFVRDLVAG